MNKLDVTKIGYRWKGVYDENTTYAKGDVVRVGSDTMVFTDDNGTKETFSVGQNELKKGQVAINSSSNPIGYDGMELHSRTDGSGFSSEFRHGKERNGQRAVSLIKNNNSGCLYVAGYHMGAIMTDGTARLWGDRAASAIGKGTYAVNDRTPNPAALPKEAGRIKRGWCFYRQTFLLDENNRLWSSGWKFAGDGNTGESTVFKPISHEPGMNIQEEIVEISGGYDYYGFTAYMALGVSGTVYAWGQQRQWHFGLKTNNSDQTTPQIVPISLEHPMKKVFCHNAQYSSSHLISREGKLFTAGQGARNLQPTDTGAFGHTMVDPWGSENAKVKWVQLHESNRHWETGSQYDHHTAVTLEDGRCYLIGNGLGQVGYGSGPGGWSYGWTIQPEYPFHTGVEKLLAKNGGYGTAVALMQDGTVEYRGYSIASPNGSNTSTWLPFNSNTAGYVGPDITNAVDLQGLGGEYGACFAVRTSDGKMICWGKGANGWPGQGDYSNVNGTTSRANNTGMDWVKCPANFVDFSIHGYCTADTGNGAIHALDDQGRTWVWGWGSYAMTQDDDNESMAVPKQVTY